MSKLTQHQLILNYLNEHGSITMMEGFSQLGITKINSRCGELKRQGHNIVSELYHDQATGKKYCIYKLQPKESLFV